MPELSDRKEYNIIENPRGAFVNFMWYDTYANRAHEKISTDKIYQHGKVKRVINKFFISIGLNIGAWGGLSFGASGGAILGSMIFPGVGTIIGAILGGLIGWKIGAETVGFLFTKVSTLFTRAVSAIFPFKSTVNRTNVKYEFTEEDEERLEGQKVFWKQVEKINQNDTRFNNAIKSGLNNPVALSIIAKHKLGEDEKNEIKRDVKTYVNTDTNKDALKQCYVAKQEIKSTWKRVLGISPNSFILGHLFFTDTQRETNEEINEKVKKLKDFDDRYNAVADIFKEMNKTL